MPNISRPTSHCSNGHGAGAGAGEASRVLPSLQNVEEPELATPWSMGDELGDEAPLRKGDLGGVISEKFVLPEQQRPRVKHDEYGDVEIPVVDMAPHFEARCDDSAAAAIGRIVGQVRAACLDWGFFHVLNHGIDAALLARIQRQANRFFRLPYAEKMKVAKQPGRYTGYGHATVKKGDILPWSEGFYIANDGSASEVSRTLWPQGDNNDFVDSYGEFNAKAQKLSELLMRVVVAGLGVDPVHFERYTKNTGGLFRLNFYPACPEPHKAIGQKAHTDFNLLTLLHVSDDVGGLQIEREGQWMGVRPRPGALAVIIGDTLQVLTNARYVSVPHRAVVNAAEARISLAYFYSPLPSAGYIVPCPELVDEQHPPKYKPFTFETFTRVKQTQFLHTLDHFARTD